MAILIILATIVLAILVISVVSSRRFEERVRGYVGISRTAFTEYFTAKGVPVSVSGVVYDTFKEKVKSDEFMPSPDMSIEEVFEQPGEDTDDDARYILRLLGIPSPTEESRESWPGHEIKTLADLVMWTDWVRCHQ